MEQQHYLAILVPEHTGGWTVLFPDFPGCASYGATVQEA
jgi:predicted RNase H-like HicB family nuclease